MDSIDYSRQALKAAEFVRNRMQDHGFDTGIKLAALVISGSGLGGFAVDHMNSEKANQVSGPLSIPYNEIFGEVGMPKLEGGVPGHAQRLLVGPLADDPTKMVMVQDGRQHPYEMDPPDLRRSTFFTRVAQQFAPNLGIVSNAAGIVTPNTIPTNSIILMNSMIDMVGGNPLNGHNDDRFGPRFAHQACVFPEDTRNFVKQNAKNLGIPLKEGTYFRWGPMYESPEQVYLLRSMAGQIWDNGKVQPDETRFTGAPVAVVGMSTVPDIQVMTHASQASGVGSFRAFKHRVGLSVATNYSASLGPNGIVTPSSHAEVQEAGRSIQFIFGMLVAQVITNSSQLA